MKTINQLLLDAYIRHAIYLQKYSSTLFNRLNKFLNNSEKQLERLLLTELAGVNEMDLSAKWKRLDRIRKEIREVREGAWGKVSPVLELELLDLSKAEAVSYERILQTSVPVVFTTTMPAPLMLQAIVTSRPFQGRLLKDWASKMQADDIVRIQTAVQNGMLVGSTTTQIVKDVIGTKGLKGADGVTQVTRNQADTVVRTAIQHVANNAREMFLDQNSDIIGEEQVVATLDSKTTAGCRALDGQIFKRGKGPQFPRHFGCRTIRVAYISPEFITQRPANPTTEKTLVKEYSSENSLGNIASRDKLPYGTKTKFDAWSRKRMRELGGPVPSTTSYNDWLKTQDVAFQNEVLGVTKAKLFREGGLQLDKFVNNSYEELTLKELAKREAEAFKRAGLNPNNY